MKGDFSRQTFDRRKRYSAVLMQQGRVQVDADWNEQQAIVGHRQDQNAAEVIGQGGAPKDNAGFGITPQGGNLLIGAGRYYVDGIVCENPTDVLYDAQEHLKGVTLPPPGGAGLYVAYLDVWQRHITSLDDPSVRETALGGPDTCTRLQRLWQVKLARVGSQDPAATCGAGTAAWLAQFTTLGTLTARVTAAPPSSGPCVLPPGVGFRRLENQLYRVEVHRGGETLASAQFKWSRDNGSILTNIVQFSGTAVEVSDLGRDEVLGFGNGEWAEIVDDESELQGRPGQLVRLGAINPDSRVIQLSSAFTPIAAGLHPKLRRWDQSGPDAGTSGIAVGPLAGSTDLGFVLEDGIEVVLTPGRYRTGDYWLIPARTAISSETGTIEWPRDGVGNPLPQPPHGIEHKYAPVAVVNFDGSAFSTVAASDCRHFFPPLTDIDAGDVGFHNDACQLPGATTVQQALDALCARREDCCGTVIPPGLGWEAALGSVADGQHAHFCLQVGTYPLTSPVTLRAKGTLTLTGAGHGTRIVAATAEVALGFENCEAVVLRDLHVESGITGTRGPQLEHLNGTLTFVDCGSVTAEHLSLRCAGGADRRAACLTVRNTAPAASIGSARIQHCDLEVGHNQTGILLINTPRVHLEDNTVRTGGPALPGDMSRLLQDRRLRARLRRELVANAVLGGGPQPSPTRATVTFGGQTISFDTDRNLTGAWQPLVNAFPPAQVSSPLDLLGHVKTLANRVLLENAVRGSVTGFRQWLAAVEEASPAVGAQGIAIGGQVAREIRILNNSISGVLEGLHLGTSHEAALGAPADTAGSVTMAGNGIQTVLVTGGLRQRYGIYVGNCESLLVENNTIRVQRIGNTGRKYVEGIHVYGLLGRLAIIRQNLVTGYNVGITFTPVRPTAQMSQWLIADNMAPGAQRAVQVPANVGGVRQSFNLT
jgi:hypothetical protein